MMLLLLNILTVASISSSNINMQVIHSQQRLLEMQRVATNVSNYILSDLDHFIHYKNYLDSQGKFAPALPDVLLMTDSRQVDVQINNLICLAETIVTGCSLDRLSPCFHKTLWQLSTTVLDRVSGAEATVIEGFSLKYLPGYCP
tara:strand:- start:5949 stop:6380 length:432 start_codon:yes stop_codon:yes gene_type:complete